MKLYAKSLLGIALLGALSAPVHAAPDDTVATVNGKPIKQSLMDYIVKEATANGQKVDDKARTVILNKLITSEMIAQEAQKQGLDKQADFRTKEELMRRELLVNSYIANYFKKNPVSDADAKTEYEQLKKQMGDKEYSARHILVKTEQEAKDVIAQLGKGGDFAKLAKEKSLDPGSKEKGGDLGWFSPGAMVKPFSDATAALAKGKYTTQPVQSQFGWHVIKLENVRTAQPPAFDTVKANIKKGIQQRNLEKALAALKDKTTVVQGKK